MSKYQTVYEAVKLAELNCNRRFNLANERDSALIKLQELCLTDGPASISSGILTLENGETINLHKLIHVLGKNEL